MSSLFKLPNVRNHTKNNGFDLSQKNAFTAKAGELLPVFCQFALPGDKINLRVQHFTRTPSIQTAAFTRIKENFDFFFVPMRLLWRYFPTVSERLYKQNPFASSLLSNQQSLNPLTSNLPHSSLAAILETINKFGSSVDCVGLKAQFQSTKLLNYLNYFYVDDNYNRSVINGSIPANPFGSNLRVNLFPLLAYQKIYQDYFRFTQWENYNSASCNVDYVGDFSSNSSNFDVLSNIPLNNRADLVRDGLFSMRYANWRKDVFTGVYPNSQFDGVSLAPVSVNGSTDLSLSIPVQTSGNVIDPSNSPVRYQKVSSSSDEANILVDSTDKDGGLFIDGNGKATISDSSDFVQALGMDASLSVLELRKALATQKLREITQAHDLTIKAQQKAHWGVDLPESLSLESIRIGSITNDLDISEVVNTNLYGSENNGQATIAGKGSSYDNSKLGHYEAKEFGVFMVIYHAVPVLDYECLGTNPQLTQTDIDDFPIPEYDRLGLDTIPSYWICNLNNVGNPSTSYAYFPRYASYKTAVDYVRGEFLQSLKSWVAPVSRETLKNTWFTNNAPSWRSFKVNPSVLDPIFGVAVGDGTDTDQFYVNAYFDCKMQRRLDVSGMPY